MFSLKKPKVRLSGVAEADQVGVEVVEHLLPEVVDAAVALVDDDEVEALDRHGGVVDHLLFLLGGLLGFVERGVFGRFVDGFARQDRIHALDGADAHLGMGVEAARCQPLHVVELGELAGVVGRRVGHEFLMRLLAEVARVHQEEHALGAAELQQPVDGRDGGKRFARAGGHVDEGAGLVERQRGFKARDGVDLAAAQVGGGQRRHGLGQAAAQGAGLRLPFGQLGRLEEVEELARAGRGVGVVGEADDLAGGFEQEAQRRVALAPFELGRGVAAGLVFNGGEVFTGFVALGLDHAHGFAVDEQHVVGGAGVGGVFAHRHALRGPQVQGFHVLHDPAGLGQLLVDDDARFGFRGHGRIIPPAPPPAPAPDRPAAAARSGWPGRARWSA